VHRDLGIQATGFPESHHPHQDIRVIALDEGRIDAQLPCRIIRKPSTRERLPRFVHPLDGEVPEIGLEQLPPVLAELHVKVSMKNPGRGVLMALCQATQVLKGYYIY